MPRAHVKVEGENQFLQVQAVLYSQYISPHPCNHTHNNNSNYILYIYTYIYIICVYIYIFFLKKYLRNPGLPFCEHAGPAVPGSADFQFSQPGSRLDYLYRSPSRLSFYNSQICGALFLLLPATPLGASQFLEESAGWNPGSRGSH